MFIYLFFIIEELISCLAMEHQLVLVLFVISNESIWRKDLMIK
jgi:hypothetical protein